MTGRRLRGLVIMAVTAIMVLVNPCGYAWAEGDAGEALPSVEPDQIIVVYRDDIEEAYGSPADELDDPAGAYEIAESEALGEAEEGSACVLLDVDLAEGVTLEDAIARIEAHPEVAYAQPNYIYYLPERMAPLSTQRVNDPKAVYEYHLDPWDYVYGWCGASVRDAWDMAKCNKTVTVAVLDSGCLVNHQDLSPNIDRSNMKDVYHNSAQGTMSDDDGHGTAVCGIVGAVANNGTGVAGVSYNARILPLKVFSDGIKPSTTSAVLVRAYNYLRTQIRTGKLTNLHVINMSLGNYSVDDDDTALRQNMNSLKSSYRVLTVCSGGNDSDGVHASPKIYPGDYDECLSVTALTSYGENAVWSDFNAYKDISAPGEGIYTTSNAGGTAYDWLDGTSAAAPVVSGVAALLWAAVPNLTVDQAITCLKTTAQPLSTYSSTYHATSGSAGALNAKKAVAYAIEVYGGGTTKIDISDRDTFYGYVQGDMTYNGKAQRPTVSLYAVNAGRLTQGVDFEVSYDNNINPGTGIVIIHGIGAYRGTRTMTFTINDQDVDEGVVWERLSGSARYQTMEAIVNRGWVDRSISDAVVIATGADFKDALAASGLAGLYNAPVLITAKGELTPETRRLLIALQPDRIFVAGGTAAVSSRTFDQIKDATGVTPQRCWGNNSASTSAAIATKRPSWWSDTAIIATNRTYKDALSAAPVAYAQAYPILLAENGRNLNADVRAALRSCGIRKVVIIGGEKAVTPNVVSQLRAAGISDIRRVWGGNAVQTSRKVAEWGLSLGMSPDAMGVATSKSFPDALCGAALCGMYDSVLVLADDDNPYNATFPEPYCYEMERGLVFGGTSAVGMRTWNTLVDCTRY